MDNYLLERQLSCQITSKPSEVRMGKGKGKISDYVCPVKQGNILFEIRECKKRIGFESTE